MRSTRPVEGLVVAGLDGLREGNQAGQGPFQGTGYGVNSPISGVGAPVLDVGNPALVVADLQSQVLLRYAEFFAA